MKKNNRNYMNVFAISLFLIISFVSIGYAALKKDLSISNTAAVIPIKDIRVSNLIATASSDSNSYNNSYSHTDDSITMNFHLNDTNSYIDYQITITNLGNKKMGIYEYINRTLPNDLTYEITNYNLNDAICDNNDNSKCTLNASKTLNIRLKYKDGISVTNGSDYTVLLGFNFKPIYTISYNVPNESYPTEIIEGATLTVDFSNNNYLITSIAIGGVNTTDYSYTNKILTISSISNDVFISVEEDYSDFEYVIKEGATSIPSTEITPDTPIDYNDLLNKEFNAKNVSSKTITQIDVLYTYTSTGIGASQTMNCTLTVGTKTYTKTITFQGKNNTSTSITFSQSTDGLTIGPNEEFKITYSIGNLKQSVTITSQTINLTFQ